MRTALRFVGFSTLAAGAVWLAVASACVAHAPPVRLAPAGVEQYADAIDWDKAGAESAQLLVDYIKVDTYNPPGNETRGAKFLAEVLARDGIESKVIELGDGRGNLIATLKADAPGSQKPLCLLSHIDVVTAEPETWEQGPLSGTIAPLADGGTEPYIWGRGALDMKGMGIVELMTVLQLKRSHVPLNRDVVLMAVADEEVDNVGMKAAVANDWPECGHLINEGGIGVKSLLFEGQTVFAISVAEKGVLWLKLRSHGEAGHGSTPVPGMRAPMELLNAASALMAREPKPRIHESLYELLRRIGEAKGGFSGFVMQRPALVDLLVEGKLMSKPATRAGITDTCQVTGYSGIGSSTNVIPSEVYASIDCRVLPGTTPEELLAQLRERIAAFPNVSLEVVAQDAANASPWDDELFASMARNAVRGMPGAIAGPVLSPGYTDSLLARPKGTHAYGFVPFEVSQEELATMHGRNERLTVKNVRRGTEVMFRAVSEVVAVPPR